MEDRLREIFNGAKKTALSAEEKAAGRELLRSYMALRPIRGDVSAAAGSRQEMVKKPFGFRELIAFVKPMSVFAVVLALMLSAGGVSYAAESALPGDALYPVKVAINEEVRAAATISATERAKWENARAERRLAEAESLAAKGLLEMKIAAQVEKRFEKHASRAQAHAARVEADNDDDAVAEIDADFEGALEAHRKILNILASAKTENDGSAGIEALIEARTKASAERRANSGKKIALKAEAGARISAEARGKAARKAAAEVRARLEKMRVRMDADAVASAQARLAGADQAVVDGDAKAAAGEYAAAFLLYLEAHRDAQEAKRFIKAGTALKKAGATLRVDLKVGDQDDKRSDGDAGENEEDKSRGDVADDKDDEADRGSDHRGGEDRGSDSRDTLLETEGRLKLRL